MNDYDWVKNIINADGKKMTKKQAAIINSAVQLFSEKGFAGTSTKEIAQNAGVAEGLIFKYYSTKKELMLMITKEIINSALIPIMSTGIDELLARQYETREELLSAFLQNRIGLLHEGLPLFKIIIQEIPFHTEIRSMLIEQLQKLPLQEFIKKINMDNSANFTVMEDFLPVISCIIGSFIMCNIIMPELFQENNLQNYMTALIKFINQGLNNK